MLKVVQTLLTLFSNSSNVRKLNIWVRTKSDKSVIDSKLKMIQKISLLYFTQHALLMLFFSILKCFMSKYSSFRMILCPQKGNDIDSRDAKYKRKNRKRVD